MRAVLCGVLLVAIGCNVKRESVPDPVPAPGAGEPPAAAPVIAPGAQPPVPAAEQLPFSTTKNRISGGSLWMFYARVSRPLPKLEHEGKRILTKLSGEWCYGIKMDKYSLLLESTDPGFVRPRIVCDLKDDRGFKKGAVGYPPVVYVEGVLRGAINLNTQPWAADWLSMTPPTSMEDFFILIDDAILVMPPRELLP